LKRRAINVTFRVRFPKVPRNFDAIEKANTFNSYYSTVFSSEGSILHIQGENTGDPFTTDIKKIRRRIKAIGKNKSVGPDRVCGEILKLGVEPLFPTFEDY